MGGLNRCECARKLAERDYFHNSFIAAAGPPEGGVIERGLHLELLDAFRRRNADEDHAGSAHGGHIDAIELQAVLGDARPVDRNRLRVAAQPGSSRAPAC